MRWTARPFSLWLYWCVLMSAGCGASALETHAKVAATSHAVLGAAKVEVESSYGEAIADQPQDTWPTIRAKFDPVVAAHAAAGTVHTAYVDAVLATVASGDDTWGKAQALISPLAEALHSLWKAGEQAGLDLPKLPAWVSEVVQ